MKKVIAILFCVVMLVSCKKKVENVLDTVIQLSPEVIKNNYSESNGLEVAGINTTFYEVAYENIFDASTDESKIVYIDLDGDGKDEKLLLTATQNEDENKKDIRLTINDKYEFDDFKYEYLGLIDINKNDNSIELVNRNKADVNFDLFYKYDGKKLNRIGAFEGILKFDGNGKFVNVFYDKIGYKSSGFDILTPEIFSAYYELTDKGISKINLKHNVDIIYTLKGKAVFSEKYNEIISYVSELSPNGKYKEMRDNFKVLSEGENIFIQKIENKNDDIILKVKISNGTEGYIALYDINTTLLGM